MAPSPNTSEKTSPLPNDQSITPISQTTRTTINTLAILRVGLGVASLVAPRWTCGLFYLNVPQSSSVIVRLFGVRDALLGELLYTAEDQHAADRGRRELKRALWANVTADTIDICSVGFAVATGSLGRLPAALFAGGAAIGVAAGAFGLKGV